MEILVCETRGVVQQHASGDLILLLDKDGLVVLVKTIQDFKITQLGANSLR